MLRTAIGLVSMRFTEIDQYSEANLLETFKLATNNLGANDYTRMQKMIPINIVNSLSRGLLNSFMNFSLSFLLCMHAKKTAQLANYKCKTFIKLTPDRSSSV